MVGGDHHAGLVGHAGLLEHVEDLTHMVIGVADAGVVAVEHPTDVGHVTGLLGLAGPTVPHRPRPEPGDLLGRMGSGPIPVALTHLFGQPGRQRVVGEHVAEARGGAIGRVGVPHVDMEEPTGAVGVTVEPVTGGRRHLVGGLQAPGPQVEALVEPGVEVVGGVPLGESADGGGPHPHVPEGAHPAVPGCLCLELTGGPFEGEVGGGAGVVDHTVTDAELPGGQGGARRQARRVRCIDTVEADTLGGQGVQVRTGGPVVPVTPEVVGPQRVDVEVDEVHRAPLVRPSGPDRTGAVGGRGGHGRRERTAPGRSPGQWMNAGVMRTGPVPRR